MKISLRFATNAVSWQIPMLTAPTRVVISCLSSAAGVPNNGRAAAAMYVSRSLNCPCRSKLPGEKIGPSRQFFLRVDFIHHNKNAIKTFVLLHKIDNVDKDYRTYDPNKPCSESIFAAEYWAHILTLS